LEPTSTAAARSGKAGSAAVFDGVFRGARVGGIGVLRGFGRAGALRCARRIIGAGGAPVKPCRGGAAGS
jgi:hypothetical protein